MMFTPPDVLLATIVLVSCGVLQLITYRILYVIVRRRELMDVNLIQAHAWASACASMASWFALVKLTSPQSPEMDDAVGMLGNVVCRLHRLRLRYGALVGPLRGKLRVVAYVLCTATWIMVLGVVWGAHVLDRTTATLVSVLAIVSTAGLVVAVPCAAEDSARRRRCRRPACFGRWSSALAAIYASEPDGVGDPRMWELVLRDGEMSISSLSMIMFVDRMFRRATIELLLQTSLSSGKTSEPGDGAIEAPAGEDTVGGASL